MFALTGVTRDYAWGSVTAIPEFIGAEPAPGPTAELWFGAHPSGASGIPELEVDLAHLIDDDPTGTMGHGAIEHFGKELPFLLKLLAPAAPLSMQVHPSLEQARDGYARACAGGDGAPVDYVDANHKPELLFPLTEFEVLSGLRKPGEIEAGLVGLDHPVLAEVQALLRDSEDPNRVADAFAHVLTTITPEGVDDIAQQCGERLQQGASPFPHSDEIIGRLQAAHPGDRGVVASLLLTPRILQPGEVMFVPAGTVHAYFRGLGVELMANSDNVLRAGLTSKNVDVSELLKVVDPNARTVFPMAEEAAPGLTRYALPVKDFELSVISAAEGPVVVNEQGPRILLALEDGVHVEANSPSHRGSPESVLACGQSVFVAHDEGPLKVRDGRVLHANVSRSAYMRM